MSTQDTEENLSGSAPLSEGEGEEPRKSEKPSSREGQLPLFGHSPSSELRSVAVGVQSRAKRASISRAGLILLAVSSLKGIGFKTVRRLFDKGLFHSYEEWTTNQVKQSLAKTFGRSSQRDHIDWIAEEKEEVVAKGEKLAEWYSKRGIQLVLKGQGEYPERLGRLEDPPRWLFARGCLDALHSESMVAMIGTRKPSDFGKRLAGRSASALASNNFVVLSGLAKGIDSAAHWGAVHCYAQSVAVLGHGIRTGLAEDQRTLAQALVDDDGVVVSEYLPTDPPSRESYLRRNKLVAALARVVIPIECPSLQSGTGATVRRALDIGTPVVGIVPAGSKVEPFVRTKESLAKLDLEVFEFTSSRHSMNPFWKYLDTECPNHRWENHRPRQDRFFREVEGQIVSKKRDMGLGPEDIDRLAERIKKSLSK
jgi:DNA protecting protein DprA